MIRLKDNEVCRFFIAFYQKFNWVLTKKYKTLPAIFIFAKHSEK
jgi:hypothetical protein